MPSVPLLPLRGRPGPRSADATGATSTRPRLRSPVPTGADHGGEEPVEPPVRGQLGVEGGGQHRALAAARPGRAGRRPRPASVASTSTPGPTSIDHRGPDEHRRHRPSPLPSSAASVGASSSALERGPPGGRSRCAAPCSRATPKRPLVRPAVEHLAWPAAPARRRCRRPAGRRRGPRRAGSKSPEDSSSIDRVVDSPPGRTMPASPSRSAGRRTGRGGHPQLGEGGQRARARRPGGRGRRRSRAAGGRATSRGRPGARSASAISWPRMASPRPGLTLATCSASSKWVVASTMARAMRAGSSLLKMPEPTKTASAPSCITSDGVGRAWRCPPAQNSGTGSRPVRATSWTRPTGAPQLLGPAVQLGRVGLGDPADVARGSSAGAGPPRRCCRCRPRPWSGSWPRPRRCGAAPRRGWWPRRRRAP